MGELSNFDWQEQPTGDLAHRFPQWANGFEQWRAFADATGGGERYLVREASSPLAVEAAWRAIAAARHQGPTTRAPATSAIRVFISHKQQDRDEAMRVANLVNDAGLPFWLDVLDPTLAGGTLSPIQVAAIIEMALLNCSHVIALLTPNSVPSRWIPYEYGRAKDPTPTAVNAACWIHPTANKSLPEYLQLGVMHHSESDILTWLPRRPPPIPWTRGPTKKLP